MSNEDDPRPHAAAKWAARQHAEREEAAIRSAKQEVRLHVNAVLDAILDCAGEHKTNLGPSQMRLALTGTSEIIKFATTIYDRAYDRAFLAYGEWATTK